MKHEVLNKALLTDLFDVVHTTLITNDDDSEYLIALLRKHCATEINDLYLITSFEDGEPSMFCTQSAPNLDKADKIYRNTIKDYLDI